MSGLHTPGPHEPAVLETDEAMLSQARELRAFLIARAEGDGDTTAAHSAYCYTLKSAVEGLIFTYEARIEMERADNEDVFGLRMKIKKLERDVELAQQPLHDQMARLNKRVIELQSELDRAALAKATGAAA